MDVWDINVTNNISRRIQEAPDFDVRVFFKNFSVQFPPDFGGGVSSCYAPDGSFLARLNILVNERVHECRMGSYKNVMFMVRLLYNDW